MPNTKPSEIKAFIDQYITDENRTQEQFDDILGTLALLSPVMRAPLLRILARHKKLHGMTLTDMKDYVKNYDRLPGDDSSPFFIENIFSPVDMLNSLIEVDKMRFMSIYGESEIRLYHDGVFHLDRIAKIQSTIKSKLQSAYQPRFSSETLKVIDTEFRVVSHEDVYHPNIINFKNGWLEIESGLFHQHAVDDDFESIVQLPFEFNPEAECPNFDDFLEDVQPKVEQQTLIFQSFACALYQGVPPLSMFIWMFVGETHTGKSTTLNILTALLGANHVSQEKIRDLANGENRFSRFQLAGKLANIDADAKVDYLRGDGLLKQISAGDRISIEGKGQAPTEVRLTSTLFIGINKLPETADTTSGFLKRLMPIRFEQQHDGDNVDEDMEAKCTTAEELSGIFNHVYPHIRSLIRRETRIKRTQREEQEVEQFAIDNLNDPIYQFVENCCATSDTQEEPNFGIDEAFEQFLDDLDAPRSKRPSKRKFRKYLSEHYNVDVVPKYIKIDGKTKRVYGYWGISLL